MGLVPRIIAEDDDLLVIEKPSGLLMHATNEKAQDEETVVAWNRQRTGEHAREVGDDPMRPGIVHRLDRDASGLLVIAKTHHAFDSLKEQFAQHRVKKEYTALVHGKIVRDEGTITLPIGRTTNKRKRGKFVAKSLKEGGRSAITHFTVARRNPRYTLLAVTTETGRTHQIRAHLASYGHPLVGDHEYASHRWKDDAPRLMLHATRLGLIHPTTSAWIEWENPLPQMFTEYLREKRI